MKSDELLLKGARVIDPSQNLDMDADVRFYRGRVVELAPSLPPGNAEVRDVSACIVTPGLIDLHAHVYWGGTSIGVNATQLALRSATATFVDAGSAGPGNFLGFRRHVIEPSRPVRIAPLLNLSFPGIFAFSREIMVGESEDLRLLDIKSCVRVAREHSDLIVGIKVRVGRGVSGHLGAFPLEMALEVAEETGLPIMAHLDHPPPSRTEVVSRLRPGDILTHCFRPFPNAPTKPGGGVRDEILKARQRGVIFDIGHGGGSLGFGTARAMLAAGFLPDVISSDVHVMSIEGPAFDLLHTLGKFHALGMRIQQLIACATMHPARVIRRPELGTLKPGVGTDASVLRIVNTPTTYTDVERQEIVGDCRWESAGLVLSGKWWTGEI